MCGRNTPIQPLCWPLPPPPLPINALPYSHPHTPHENFSISAMTDCTGGINVYVLLIVGELAECPPSAGNTGDPAQVPQLDSPGVHL